MALCHNAPRHVRITYIASNWVMDTTEQFPMFDVWNSGYHVTGSGQRLHENTVRDQVQK